jgi:hypothetical protein
MSDDASTATDAASVPVDRGASAHLSFDTVDATDECVRVRVLGDDDPVGVELTVDLGAVGCEVVLGPDAAADLTDRLADCRDALNE